MKIHIQGKVTKKYSAPFEVVHLSEKELSLQSPRFHRSFHLVSRCPHNFFLFYGKFRILNSEKLEKLGNVIRKIKNNFRILEDFDHHLRIFLNLNVGLNNFKLITIRAVARCFNSFHGVKQICR